MPDSIILLSPTDPPQGARATVIPTDPIPTLPDSAGAAGSTAVLLVNLGTPAAPTAAAVRRFLAEFLADPRVVELPAWLWRPVLHGAVIPLRSARVARAYASIWHDQGSPLLVYTRDLARALQQELGPQVTVAWAMRYGTPSIPETMRQLAARGLRRLLLVPLYPQYSATTTASVFDAVARELASWRWQPELRYLTDYWQEATWQEAIAGSIRSHWQRHGRGDHLLFSFHGIPQACVDAGDPYQAQCRDSARAVAGLLELADADWSVSFQSRLGRAQWLLPYTEQVVRDQAAAGVGQLDVLSPGFAVDCLETLEEIAMEYAQLLRDNGGGRLTYIPALNDQPSHVRVMAGLARRHGRGWPGFDPPAGA